MNPLAAATTFATLVGLICNFRQEKGKHEALNHQEFIEWLEYHRHEELKNLIVNTAALRTEVDKLLRSDHAKMLQKLDHIGEILVSLVGRLDEFRGLASAVAPGAGLSDQSISIIRQLVNSGTKKFSYEDIGDEGFILNVGGDDHLEVSDIRFLDDDVKALLELRLICHEDGTLFRITRNAVRFIETIDKKPGPNV